MRNESVAYVQLAEDVGFAIATMKAFLTPPGTTGSAVKEAIDRLEGTQNLICSLLNEDPALNHTSEQA